MNNNFILPQLPDILNFKQFVVNKKNNKLDKQSSDIIIPTISEIKKKLIGNLSVDAFYFTNEFAERNSSVSISINTNEKALYEINNFAFLELFNSYYEYIHALYHSFYNDNYGYSFGCLITDIRKSIEKGDDKYLSLIIQFSEILDLIKKEILKYSLYRKNREKTENNTLTKIEKSKKSYDFCIKYDDFRNDLKDIYTDVSEIIELIYRIDDNDNIYVILDKTGRHLTNKQRVDEDNKNNIAVINALKYYKKGRDYKKKHRFISEYSEKIKNISVQKCLLSIIEKTITRPKIFDIHYGNKETFKLADISDFKEEDGNCNDLVVPLLLSLSNSLENSRIINTTNNQKYLKIGNGIFAKIIVRRNIMFEKVYPFIALVRQNGSFTFEKNIFSGYTNSGFILPHGLYIISEKYVFEIYFDANSVLCNTSFIQPIQNISDSALIIQEEREEEERKREEESWDY